MKKRAHQSVLQDRILLYLASDDSESLTKLAARLSVHRSSVSRAMHALEQYDLVCKNGNIWHLTTKGEREIAIIQYDSATRASKTARIAVRLISQNTAAMLSRNRILIQPPDLVPNFDTIVNITQMVEPLLKIADSLNWVNSVIAQIPIKPVLDPVTGNNTIASTTSLLGATIELPQVSSEFMTNTIRTIVDTELSTQEITRPLMSALRAFPPPTVEMVAPLLQDDNTINALRNLGRSIMIDTAKFTAAEPSLTEILARTALEAGDSLVQPTLTKLNSQLVQEAMSSLVESQRLNLAFLDQFPMKDVGKDFLTNGLYEINVELSQMVRMVGQIYRHSLETIALPPHYSRQLLDMSEVTRTYRDYLAHAIGTLQADVLQPFQVVSRSLMPTWTTSAYIASTRIGVTSQSKDVITVLEPDNSHLFDRLPLQEVDIFLGNLGPNFSSMWHGSWDAIRSSNPDRIRQAAHSGRELLMQILQHLAPDACFNDEQIKAGGWNGKPTRKMRVKQILSDSGKRDINWAYAVANALDETYAYLAAISHDRSTRPETNQHQVIGLLHTLGGLILFLDSSRQGN